MSEIIKFASEARQSMAEGIKTLYDATRITLGPKGRNAIIEQIYGTPLIVNDGVTIAKSIDLVDKFAALGAQIIIEAATKTNDVVGDGTTTAILLASEIILNGLNKIDDGVNPVDIKNGLEYLLPQIIKMIDDLSTPITTLDDLAKIATISSGSKEIGDIICKAYEEIGEDGVITIEEAKSIETSLSIVKGYSYNRGYLSVYMVNSESNITTFIEPLILITNRKIRNMNEIVKYLEEAMKKSKTLLIICDDVEQEVLTTLVLNKLRGVFDCVITKVPDYGEKRNDTLRDLSFITGATLIDESIGMTLIESDTVCLGSCKKAIISKDQTIIVDGANSDENLYKHVQKLKETLDITKSAYERENLEERIAKLLGGVAIIKVGAATEPELKNKKLRLEDALNATKAAMKSGIIEGGGKVLYSISDKIDLPVKYQSYIPALDILKKALKRPFMQILENTGVNINEVMNKINQNKWYNAETNTIENLFEAGIIDPASVAKTAIINAISVAGAFLTTECAIINKHEKEPLDENNLM